MIQLDGLDFCALFAPLDLFVLSVTLDFCALSAILDPSHLQGVCLDTDIHVIFNTA